LALPHVATICVQNQRGRPTLLTLYHLITDIMELSPSWESDGFSASQEIPRILRNLKVHYWIRKCHQVSLSWARFIQSMPPHPTSWWSIVILSSYLRLGLPIY